MNFLTILGVIWYTIFILWFCFYLICKPDYKINQRVKYYNFHCKIVSIHWDDRWRYTIRDLKSKKEITLSEYMIEKDDYRFKRLNLRRFGEEI